MKFKFQIYPLALMILFNFVAVISHGETTAECINKLNDLSIVNDPEAYLFESAKCDRGEGVVTQVDAVGAQAIEPAVDRGVQIPSSSQDPASDSQQNQNIRNAREFERARKAAGAAAAAEQKQRNALEQQKQLQLSSEPTYDGAMRVDSMPDPAADAEQEEAYRQQQQRAREAEGYDVQRREVDAARAAAAVKREASEGEGLDRDTQKPNLDDGKSTAAAAEAALDTDRRLINTSENNQKICEKKLAIADVCCNNPERCLFSGNDGAGTDGSEIASVFFQTALGISTAMVPAMSVGAMCNKMNNAAQIMTAVNLYLGHRCSTAVSDCKSACQSAQNQTSNAAIRCRGKDTENCKKIVSFDSIFEGHAKTCRQYDNQSVRLATQAVANQVGAKMAKMCEDQSKGDHVATDPFADPDCSTPAAAASAFCQELCSRPGAEVNPKCAGFNVVGNNNPGNPYTKGSELDGPGLFESGIDVDEGTQSPVFTDTAATNKGLNGGNGGGGGSAGLGGSGSDFGGVGSGSGGGSGGGGGYNTKIDRGLASGNGYSSVGGVLRTGAGGGFSGYGGRGAITQSGSKFNLRDFLPDKGKNSKLAARLPQALVADVGPSHTDIFKKVTDRFYQVCLRNALYDCVSAKKKD